MAKFLYSAAMSLDGFIAGPGGDVSWLVDFLGPNPVVDELIPQVGALLVGGRTYGGDDPHRGREGEGKAVDAAASAAGDKFVCILGASVAAHCLAMGVLDEVLVSIVPVLLGDGTRFFERSGGAGVRLEPVSRSHTTHLTNLWFRVIRP
jgi:dihydrofolate reductase